MNEAPYGDPDAAYDPESNPGIFHDDENSDKLASDEDVKAEEFLYAAGANDDLSAMDLSSLRLDNAASFSDAEIDVPVDSFDAEELPEPWLREDDVIDGELFQEDAFSDKELSLHPSDAEPSEFIALNDPNRVIELLRTPIADSEESGLAVSADEIPLQAPLPIVDNPISLGHFEYQDEEMERELLKYGQFEDALANEPTPAEEPKGESEPEALFTTPSLGTEPFLGSNPFVEDETLLGFEPTSAGESPFIGFIDPPEAPSLAPSIAYEEEFAMEMENPVVPELEEFNQHMSRPDEFAESSSDDTVSGELSPIDDAPKPKVNESTFIPLNSQPASAVSSVDRDGSPDLSSDPEAFLALINAITPRSSEDLDGSNGYDDIPADIESSFEEQNKLYNERRFDTESAEESEENTVNIEDLLNSVRSSVVSPDWDIGENSEEEESVSMTAEKPEESSFFSEEAAMIEEPIHFPALPSDVLSPPDASEEVAPPPAYNAFGVTPFVMPMEDELRQDISEVLTYFDEFLADLPEEKVRNFAYSPEFSAYKKLFEELELKR